MAPLSHFAIAALAVVSVAAAPLLTQPSSKATLERRQGKGGSFSNFIYDLIQYYAEEEFMKGVGEISYKPDMSNGFDYEKKLQDAPPQAGQ
ncbi:hypothetical protein KCU62_g5230, partial [Aureobasidium sp. EXF-3399]